MAAAVWSISSWNEYVESRGWWTLAPLVWFVGSVVLVVLQLVVSLMPSVILARATRERLPKWLRMTVITTAWLGLAISVGGAGGIWTHSKVTPTPHRVGP